MTGFSSVLIIVAVAALAALGGWWYWGQQSARPPEPSKETSTAAATTTLPSGTSTSDAALDQDLTSIDGQIQAFNADSANVDAGLSDQPVPQSSI